MPEGRRWVNPDGSAKTIASWTAEQTATFFAGGELGPATIHDPQLKADMDRVHSELQRCFYGEVIPAIMRAMERQSGLTRETRRRLTELHTQAAAGDPRAAQLLGVMLNELAKFGLGPAPQGAANLP